MDGLALWPKPSSTQIVGLDNFFLQNSCAFLCKLFPASTGGSGAAFVAPRCAFDKSQILMTQGPKEVVFGSSCRNTLQQSLPVIGLLRCPRPLEKLYLFGSSPCVVEPDPFGQQLRILQTQGLCCKRRRSSPQKRKSKPRSQTRETIENQHVFCNTKKKQTWGSSSDLSNSEAQEIHHAVYWFPHENLNLKRWTSIVAKIHSRRR